MDLLNAYLLSHAMGWLSKERYKPIDTSENCELTNNKVITYIRNHPGTKCENIAKALDISPVLANKILVSLYKMGKLERGSEGYYIRKRLEDYL